MLYHKQEHLVTEENPVKRGSCYPTVLACLLDKPLHEVPYFHLFYWTQEEKDNFTKVFADKYCDGNYETANENSKHNFSHNLSVCLNLWHNVMQYWLASQGYRIEMIMIEDYKEWLSKNKDVPYLVSGKSSRGVKHVVIFMNGERPANGRVAKRR